MIMNQDIFRLVLYTNGEQEIIQINLNNLPPSLREEYRPFIGKTVTWDHGEIVENEEQGLT